MIDITNFKNNWIGKRVDFDHVYGYQCVDLVRQYFYEGFGLGNSAGGGNAIDYWTNPPAGVLTKFNRVDGSDARNGDIVILRGLEGNPYGHIGIGTGSVTSENVEILEQNGASGNGSGVGPDAIRTRWVARSRVAGLLRPKDESPAPLPQTTPGLPFTIAHIAAKRIQLKSYPVGEWNLSHTQWSSFTSDPIMHDGGAIVTISAIAYHRLGGAYYMQSPDISRGFNLVDCIDYVEPSSEPVQAPVEAQINYATHYTYSKLEAPLSLQTNRDANKWNLDFDDYPNARSVELLAKGTSFVAYGKAQRNDLGHEVYYLSEDDFAKAPVVAHGINTVDLEPVVPPVQEATSPAVDVTDGESIPVHVTPTDPNKWKSSYNALSAGTYTAIEDVTVHDLTSEMPDLHLMKGQTIRVAGSFNKDFVTYLRTKKSLENDWWYGIPIASTDLEEFDEDGDIFDPNGINLNDELEKAFDGLSLRARFIIRTAKIDAFFRAVFGWLNRRK